jgi:EmrB/QacA subfamily drug resistance transporter
MVILDVTVVNVALPAIGADLRLDRASLTWVVTAYTLTFGGLLLLGGRLSDTIGRRRTFLIGLGLFTAASLASGLADSGTMLVASRAAQGIGAALLSPAALSIVTTTFHGRERHRALGIWATIGGAGAAVGVLLGGALTSGPGWEWAFLIYVPVGVVVAAALPALVAASPRTRVRGRIDVLGAVSVTAAVGLLIFGLVRAGDDGWDAATTLVPLAAAVAFAALFVWIERTARTPLVRLSVLTQRPLLAGGVVMFAASGLLISAFFITSLYLQQLLGFTALRTGLVFLPVAIAIIVGAHLGSRAIGRIGGRKVAVAGFAAAALGAALLTRLPADGQVLTDVLPGFLLLAAGLGAAFVAATTGALGHIPAQDAGLGSGVINTSHELGAAFGVALMSTIAGASVAGGTVGGLPPVDGFQNAFVACVVVAVLTALAALALLPAGRPPSTDGHVFAH